MWNMQEFGIQIELTMTGHNWTATSRKTELCTWYCICMVKCSWWMKPYCWTLRRPTPMTTWKPRSRETTRSTTRTRERARSVAVFVVLVLCCHTHLLHTSHGSRCSSVCLIPSHGHRHAWSERSLWLPWPLHDLQLPSLIPNYPPFNFPDAQRRTSSSIRSPWPKRFPEQRFLEDVDYDDATIGEMLLNAYREQVDHSQREGLSVGQSSSSMSDRTVQPVVETVAKSHDRTVQSVAKTGQERNINRLGPFWIDRGGKSSPTVRRRLEDTDSRLTMTEEVYKN